VRKQPNRLISVVSIYWAVICDSLFRASLGLIVVWNDYRVLSSEYISFSSSSNQLAFFYVVVSYKNSLQNPL